MDQHLAEDQLLASKPNKTFVTLNLLFRHPNMPPHLPARPGRDLIPAAKRTAHTPLSHTPERVLATMETSHHQHTAHPADLAAPEDLADPRTGRRA